MRRAVRVSILTALLLWEITVANSTKTLAKDGTWTELTAGAVPASVAFVNEGPATILVQYGLTAAPADVNGRKADGIPYKPSMGDRPLTPSRMWARVELADAVVGSVALVHVEEA